MIYISSSCVRHKYIRNSIKDLVEQGYSNIELSGGTQPYSNLIEDLISLKKEFHLNYRCHNYFPPPEEPFILNLASPNKKCSRKSLDHIKKAIELTEQLGGKEYGFHAGFFIDIPVSEIGRPITPQSILPKDKCIKTFYRNVRELRSFTDLDLYIENNVLSFENYQRFNNSNPFMCASREECLDVINDLGLKLLLDVAHLKVSCNSLSLDFPDQMASLLEVSDYIHISDNDALSDSNQKFIVNSQLFNTLSKNKELLKDKTFTIEVYSGLSDLQESLQTLKQLIQ